MELALTWTRSITGALFGGWSEVIDSHRRPAPKTEHVDLELELLMKEMKALSHYLNQAE